ncbi:MAG: hypothetical protein ABS987_05315, partial [Ruminococcus sp.]
LWKRFHIRNLHQRRVQNVCFFKDHSVTLHPIPPLEAFPYRKPPSTAGAKCLLLQRSQRDAAPNFASQIK